MKPIHAVIANITERINGEDYPALQVYVPYENRWGGVFYSDPVAANRIGLHDVRIHTPEGLKTEKDGMDFVRNLWRHFAGKTSMICDRPVDGYVFDTKHHGVDDEE